MTTLQMVTSYKWEKMKSVIQLADFMKLNYCLNESKHGIGFHFLVYANDDEIGWIKKVFYSAEDFGFMRLKHTKNL